MLLDFINPLVRDVDGIDEDPSDEVGFIGIALPTCSKHMNL